MDLAHVALLAQAGDASFTTLTELQNTFVDILKGGHGNILGHIKFVMWCLAGIEVVLFGMYFATQGMEVQKLVGQVFRLGFFQWLVLAFPEIANDFMTWLVDLGLKAIGFTGGNHRQFLDPSYIFARGLDRAGYLSEKISQTSLNIGFQFILGLVYVLVMLIFVAMAWQVLVAVVEFHLHVLIAGPLVAFGMSSHTSFLSEKAIGSVVASSVKLMALSIVMAIADPLIDKFAMSGEHVELKQLWTFACSVGFFGFLSWKAPQTAAGFLAGQPSLTGADLMQAGQAALGNVVTAASAVAGGAAGAWAGAKVAAGGAATGTAKAAGFLAQSATPLAAAGGGEGASPSAASAGGASGVARASAGALVKGIKGGVDRAVVSPLRDSYRDGQAAALHALGIGAPAPADSKGDAGGASDAKDGAKAAAGASSAGSALAAGGGANAAAGGRKEEAGAHGAMVLPTADPHRSPSTPSQRAGAAATVADLNASAGATVVDYGRQGQGAGVGFSPPPTSKKS